MRIGIDLGGTKTEIIALDEAGNDLYRTRVPSPQGSYAATIENIEQLIHRCEAELGTTAHRIGIGTPGAISQSTGLLKNSNSTWLNGKPFLADLENKIGRTLYIANDANCFALSEAIDGAASGKDVVFGVIIGTGTGGGIVVRQQILEGPNRIAGEWGHNPLPWREEDEIPGPACYCGKQGCIETWLSGPGMAAGFTRDSGRSLTPADIFAAWRQGDEIATRAADRYFEHLARGLAHVINILDPDAIVLGGGMSNIEEIYAEVPQRWQRYIFSDSVNTLLLKAKHGDSSGVRGAAWL